MKSFGNFVFTHTEIDGVILIEPQIYGDNRGYFFESYHKEHFKSGGIDTEFVQDNQSKSKKGVLRGLHFQTKNIQGKLVRVISGEVFDVVVDLRKGSRTYGKWFGAVLSSENYKQLFAPAGFAHGFLVMSKEAEFVYKCTDYYNSEAEGGIRWNDPDINIHWPIEDIVGIIMSDKDMNQPWLCESKITL